MKILLGTTSDQKANIVKSALDHLKDLEVALFSVKSGIIEQPLDEQTTITGSINRAKNAIKAYKKNDFDFSVGLEGGLSCINGLYNLVCAAAIVDKNGKIFVGLSKKTPLPKTVSLDVEKGKELGVAIREYDKLINDKDKEFLEIKSLTSELINRRESFFGAISSAYLQYKFSKNIFN